jgi:hypothetical protein
MRYLCLIYLNEQELAAMPEPQMSALNSRHLQFNDDLLAGGQFVEAEALEAGSATTCVRVRHGKAAITDGPYAETKEQVAGFYLIEARDLDEALQVSTRIPSAPLGTIELRPCRDLIVDGVKHKASRKPR